jgi:hypothetical protein
MSGTRSGRTFLITGAIIASFILDAVIKKVLPFIPLDPNLSYEIRIASFIIILVVYVIGGFSILYSIRNSAAYANLKRANFHFSKINKIMMVIHITLATILVSVGTEMWSRNFYHVIALTLATTISYSAAAGMMAFLGYKFLLWYKTKKNISILLYSLSAILITANAVVTVAFLDVVVSAYPSVIIEHRGLAFSPFIPSQSLLDRLSIAYTYTSVLSFAIWWLSTTNLLSYYRKKLGNIKYFVIMSTPLLYFLFQFIPLEQSQIISLFQGSTETFLVYTIVFSLSETVGGILFGISFWTITRRLAYTTPMKDFIVLASCGLILFFVSNQALLLTTFSYPPFGLADVSFVAISSYAILVGMYGTAVEVSYDIQLRKTIRKSALERMGLIDSIGTAYMEEDIKNRVTTLTTKHRHTLGNEIKSLQEEPDEETMREYIKDTLKELHKTES